MIRTAMDRKSSFLGMAPWTDLPWIETPKDARQYVCDIGFHLASLLERADTVFPPFENTPHRQTIALELLSQVRDYLHQFDALDLENATANGDEYELDFKNMQSVIATTHCWGLHMYMRLLVAPLLEMLNADPDLDWKHPEARDLMIEIDNSLGEAECRRTCRKIHAAARFCLRDEMRYVGSRRLTFPLLSANYFLWQTKLPELQECQRLTKQACEGSGVGIGKHIGKGVSERFVTFTLQKSSKEKDVK